MTAVIVPQLSISMEEAKVSRWLVEDGDAVAAGQPVVEVETDKATVEIEAPVAGLLRIVAGEGAIVVVDGVLAELEPAAAGAAEAVWTDGAGAATAPASVSSVAPALSSTPAARVVAEQQRPAPIASPAARRLARERGVELASLQGSGPGGRIVARDIATGPAAGGHVAAPGADDRLRAAVVANITASWQQIPHVHIGGELAADGVMRARASAPPDAAVTVTDLLVVALARALAEVPELNALRRADGSVERSQAVHLSIAVATASGVVAPVLRDAESLTLGDVAQARRRLVEAARQGTLDGRDLAGGTCTLSNLGAYPVDFFAPVVSGPQVAMVATGRVADRPIAVDGLVGVRPTMWVNVAVDHRAADGEAGGRLLAAFERQIALLPGGLA
jgi:pyruvate dehydrogenase E2 component (dihydrolipoyllysine-residue acetyltransferase)